MHLLVAPGSVGCATFGALALWSIAMCRAAALAERGASEFDTAEEAARSHAPYLRALAVALVAACVRPLESALTLGVACVALVAAAPADVRTGLLFDAVTLPTALAVIACSTFFDRVDLAATGALCVGGFFAVLVAASRGAWMGLGDVKAIFAIGAAFGPVESVLAIFVACLSGIALASLRPQALQDRSLPFGPHLAIGACAVLVCGPEVEHAWMHLT